MGRRGRVVCIPNPAPSDQGRRAALDAPVVVAAGSLTRRKGFDRLLEAWARLAPRFPDWRLKIFGTGHRRSRAGGADRQAGRPWLRPLVRPFPADARRARERLGVRVDVPQRGLPDGAARGDGRRAARRGLRLPDRAARHHHRRRRRACGPERPHPPPRRGARRADGGRAAAAAGSAPPRSRTSTRYRIDAIGARWEALFGELRGRPRRP